MQYPEPADFRSLLQDLIGKDVSVSAASGVDPSAMCHSTFVFVDDDDVPRCYAGSDLALAHSMGAALAMMPAGRANETAPDADLLEFNLEVVNVISGQINNLNKVHIRLIPGSDGKMEWPHGKATTAYTVEVEGYRPGIFAFAAV